MPSRSHIVAWEISFKQRHLETRFLSREAKDQNWELEFCISSFGENTRLSRLYRATAQEKRTVPGLEFLKPNTGS